MQTIGEKLEEARKRKGISLREAAESIKIRIDYLQFFENNEFDFDLPEIYKTGFFKNYARYLEMDVNAIAKEYLIARRSAKSSISRKDNREFYGQINLGALNKTSDSVVASKSDIAKEEGGYNGGSSVGSVISGLSDQQFLYIKIGAAAVGALIFLSLLFTVFSSCSSDDESEDYRESASRVENGDVEPNDIDLLPEVDSIYIIASKNVLISITQVMDNKVLFRGTVKQGERMKINRRGQIKIMASEVKDFVIEKNGKKFRMGTAKSGSALGYLD